VNYRALLIAFGLYIAAPFIALAGMLIASWVAQ